MIRDIRPLQSIDQNRLRDDHARHEAKDGFARHLAAANEAEREFASRTNKRTNAPSPNLIGGNLMWSQFFADLTENNVNDSTPLFHWGEQREAAKQHTQNARRNALLNGETPYHLLNEKI